MIRTLGELPTDARVYFISIRCEGLNCEHRYLFYCPNEAPPFPLDLDIPQAFEGHQFKCKSCGGDAVNLSIYRDMTGAAPEWFLKLHNREAAARLWEAFQPQYRANLAWVREKFG